jgi:uncharacterized protein with PQ loop repeat
MKNIALTILAIFASGASFFLAIGAIIQGKIPAREIKGWPINEVLRANEPVQFWIYVGVFTFLGILLLLSIFFKK